MATGHVETKLPNQGPAPAPAVAFPRPQMQQTAISNWALPAKGARAGVAVGDTVGAMAPLPSQPHVPNTGATSFPGAAAGAGWNLPAKSGLSGAVQPREAAPAAGGAKWSLPSKILSVAELQPPDGCIRRFDNPTVHGMCSPVVVYLGPLFPSVDQRREMEETKWKYVHNLLLRAHRKGDVEKVMSDYLCRIESKEPSIRQRYDPSECLVNPQQLVEMMVLDGLFVIEVLIKHWTGKIDGSASPRTSGGRPPAKPDPSKPNALPPLASTMVPQALREDFTPLSVGWEPQALRFDLVAVPNQIPFFVLQELFEMTDIPELGQSQKQPAMLRKLVIDYLVGSAGEVLAGYEGPVYHILHLVYLHLTFSKETQLVPALQPKPPPPRPSVAKRLWAKLKEAGLDIRALWKRTASRSSNLPLSWQLWKVIPPARELTRVGVRLKRAETHRFADVKFKNGALEIPAFAWRRYHIRLLANLVVLEVAGWWPPEKRLFCSYVMFMTELIPTKDDAELLLEAGIVQYCNADEVDLSLITPFRVLADFNHGSKYQCHFAGLVRDLIKCHERWSKLGITGCCTST